MRLLFLDQYRSHGGRAVTNLNQRVDLACFLVGASYNEVLVETRYTDGVVAVRATEGICSTAWHIGAIDRIPPGRACAMADCIQEHEE
jgi:hypothetical protein